MQEAPTADIPRYRATVIGTLPQFVGGSFEVPERRLGQRGAECDGWIFKFPRNADAEARLRRSGAARSSARHHRAAAAWCCTTGLSRSLNI